MTGPRLALIVTEYVDRVVNRRDISAVDELVSTSFRGSGFGWPADRPALRQFYEEQYRNRPDWHIDIEETVELGSSVVVRALAGGRAQGNGQWHRKRLEWLAHYRLCDGQIIEINVLDLVERDP